MSARRLATVAALGAALAGAPGVSAETIAFVRGDRAYTARADGSGVTLRSRGIVIGVGFGRLGKLYVTRPSGPGLHGEVCDLYAARGHSPVVRSRDVLGRGTWGLCRITGRPQGGLLFESSSEGIELSERVRLLDPETGQVEPAARGYHPALDRTGRRLLVVRSPGLRQEPVVVSGQLGEPHTFRPVVPPRPRGAPPPWAYAAPSFSRDGTRLAAARTERYSVKLVVGRPGGPVRSVWRVGRDVVVGKTAWLRDGSAILVLVFRGDSARSDLWRMPLAGGRPEILLRNVTDFALHQRPGR